MGPMRMLTLCAHKDVGSAGEKGWFSNVTVLPLFTVIAPQSKALNSWMLKRASCRLVLPLLMQVAY